MKQGVSRRDALKILSGVTGALLAPCGALAQPLVVAPPAPAAARRLPTVLRVSVHQPGGTYLEREASVTLRDAGEPVSLRRARTTGTYDAVVTPGPHRLVVTADGFAEADYTVNVPPAGLAVPVYLGQPGWPWFHMGQSIVPFEPREDLIAVAFTRPALKSARWTALLQQAERIGLVPYPEKDSYLAAKNTIAIFQSAKLGQKIFGTTEGRLAADVIENIVALFGRGNVRVGMPIDVRPGHVKILDNTYVVGFHPNRVAGRSAQDLASAQKASASRVAAAADAWLFEFVDKNDYRAHLNAVEALGKRDDIAYAEPNLIVELQEHSCADAGVAHSCANLVAASTTNDPWSNCQTSLALQGVPDAWCFLEQTVGPDSKRGSADVSIATVDFGINKTHPDASASLLDYVCLSEVCDAIPEDPHGMSVYGIVSATPDNSVGTSGIAPGVHHLAIAMRSQWTNSTQYAEMILWLAGVESPVTFSQPPLARPPDIISCSHGIADLPTANPIADAFSRLTQEGRKRSAGSALGTVLVYSAGNATPPQPITGTQALAADPNVIAVGNTLPPDASGVERLAPDSNFGDRLDLCAQGEHAPSLLADPAQIAAGDCAPSVRGPGAWEFAGTSAACPMVAATAALMLTVNRDLAWGDVRDLLRQTARCIDPDGGDWQEKRSPKYGSGRLDVHAAVQAAAHPAPAPA
jgi:subtilisin family serine protease